MVKKKKDFVVVAYDVVNDKRRNKIAKILTYYGIRCNKSVFECMLTESRAEIMKKKIGKITDPTEDCILFYYLCYPCTIKRDSIGKKSEFAPEIVII